MAAAASHGATYLIDAFMMVSRLLDRRFGLSPSIAL
jgi:hypothetical protein